MMQTECMPVCTLSTQSSRETAGSGESIGMDMGWLTIEVVMVWPSGSVQPEKKPHAPPSKSRLPIMAHIRTTCHSRAWQYAVQRNAKGTTCQTNKHSNSTDIHHACHNALIFKFTHATTWGAQ
jgi:hypothetical protein